MIYRSTNEMRKITIFIMMLVSFCMLASFAGALPIEITNPTPSNGATDVTPSLSLSVNSIVNSSNGSAMTGRCWTNCTGTFMWSNWVGPFTNTTLNWNLNVPDYSTKYYWGMYVNDSWGNNLNQTWNFTTEDEPTAPVAPSGPHTLRNTPGVNIGLIILMSLVLTIWALNLIWTIFSGTKKLNAEAIKNQLIIVLVLVIILGIILSMI
jgi:hypothetical protein